MMAEVDTVMTEFYNVLYKLRYPKITEVESKNIASIIFTGENRIHLLSWLLAEKIPHIATVLGKLEGSALQDELAKYYSQLGICINKDILLGKCTLEVQLPTLILLLEFIKNVLVDTIDISSSGTELIANLLTEYLNENTDANNIDINPKRNLQAVTNSGKLKKGNGSYNQNKTSFTEESSSDSVKYNDNEHKESFISQMDKFIDAYESVSSWPTSVIDIKSTAQNDMNTCAKNIYSDFMTLKQVLRMKNEIPKLVIPQEPPARYTSLNSIVEDMVTSMDEDFSKM